MLKSKIHRARVTAVNIDYQGSITIDEKLMRKADILPYEQVQVLNLNNGADLRADQLHSARHDQPDITTAHHDGMPARDESVDIDQPLGRTGGHNAGRTGSRDLYAPPVPLAAPHGQDDRTGGETLQTGRS